MAGAEGAEAAQTGGGRCGGRRGRSQSHTGAELLDASEPTAGQPNGRVVFHVGSGTVAAQQAVVVKMLALGLAVSVILDATLVRLVLVPATMFLMGSANWWFPRRLDRVLPHLEM